MNVKIAGLVLFAVSAALAVEHGLELVSRPRDVVAAFAPVRGRCDAARTVENEGEGTPPPSVGSWDDYDEVVCIQDNRTGSVRVRANAVFDVNAMTNVIGTVRSGLCVRAEGPLKDADVPGGIAYAIPVEDDDGTRCRGYVADRVVHSL